ncbi:MAG: CPBP family intramembrane metalloprotease [Clostridia bacterium]|nr:CPBP family intramembrane metalloprotease [Clostridia bacterium]
MEDVFANNTEDTQKNYSVNIGFRTPGLFSIGLLYSITVLLLLLVGSRLQRTDLYLGILITEIGLIMLPALILLILFRYDLRKVIRLNRLKLVNAFYIIGIMCFALPLAGVLNIINLLVIKNIFGKIIINQPPAANDLPGLLISILVIGASAGICEEVLFRGVIQRGLERLGAVRAILLTAFLFGLMHVDFQKLLGTFILGVLIGFIVYRTNSIYGGMLAHFTNNSIAVLLAFAFNKLAKLMESSGLGNNSAAKGDLDFSAITALAPEQLVAVIVFWGIVVLGCAALFTVFMVLFVNNTSKTVVKAERELNHIDARLLIGFAPGTAAVIFIYVVQGLKMKGISIPIIESLLVMLGLK